MQASTEIRSERKPFHATYIDGLRAIAVLSVILYHLDPGWLPGGFTGVDVFFVISGFVVAMSASGIGQIGFTRFLMHFYARRLARITPALVTCLLVTFVAAALFIPEAWLSSTNQRTGLYAFFGLSNFVLSAHAAGYFSPIAEFNPFTHTWSLAVEEQFYLAFPLMFYLWASGRRRASIAIFALAFVASLAAAALIGPRFQTQAFYMIWSRFWELAVGVLLFQILHARGHSFHEESPARPWHAWLAAAGFALLVAGLFVARPEAAPYPACVISVAGAALILGALHGRPHGGLVHALLTNRSLVFVGKISYSLYLWHWPTFVLLRWTVGLEPVGSKVAAIAITAVLAVLSYLYIEQPPRRLARHARKPAMVAAGLALIASGCASAALITFNQKVISLSTVTRNKELWYPEGPLSVKAPNGCEVVTTEISFPGGNAQRYALGDCRTHAAQAPAVFVLGDSHAMHYQSLLKRLAADTDVVVWQYAVGGCSFISIQPWRERDQCAAFGKAAMADMLPRIKPGDVVFLASLRLPRMVDQWAVIGAESARKKVFSDEAQAGREQRVQDSVPILREFVARGARVVFEAPTPMLESIPYRCADWFNRENSICARGMSLPRATLDELRAPILNAYARIKAEVPGVEVWDPLPILCPGTDCHAYRDDKPLLFDGDHLSYYSNMLLLPSFRTFVARS